MRIGQEPPRREKLRGYVITGCIKCGGRSKWIRRGPHDCCLRKDMSRAREKQEWRRTLRD
jgi:hypothetical protein